MLVMRMADHGGVPISDIIDRLLPGELDLWEVYGEMFGPVGRDRTDMQTASITQAVLAASGVQKPMRDLMVYAQRLESEEERRKNAIRGMIEMGKRMIQAQKFRERAANKA